MSNQKFDHKLKMLMLGHSGAGKTCLLMRYIHQCFTETFITTIGIDYKIKFSTLNDMIYRVMWWDTAGQERFRSISASYISGAQGVAVVFDLCDRNSFLDAENWIRDIRQRNRAKIVLLANKCDMRDHEVTREEVTEFAKKHNVPFFYVSARTGQGVDEALDHLFTMTAQSTFSSHAAQAAQHPIASSRQQSNVVSLTSHDPSSSSKQCC